MGKITKAYQFLYKTPHSKIYVEADSAGEIQRMVAAKVFAMVTPPRDFEGLSLVEAAKRALKIYKASMVERKRHPRKSSIETKAVELDVIRCYLENMAISQIVEWLTKNRDVKISKSALGRYCSALIKLRIYPLDYTRQVFGK